MEVEKKNRERKGFLAAVTVGRGSGGGRTGCRWMENLGAGPVEGERGWRENGFGGKFLEGGK
jgi:hypothetical protein